MMVLAGMRVVVVVVIGMMAVAVVVAITIMASIIVSKYISGEKSEPKAKEAKIDKSFHFCVCYEN